jgi:outer membrane protein assembly factor BamB
VAPAQMGVITINDPSPGSYLLFGYSIDSANGLLIVGLPGYDGGHGEALVFDATTGSLIRTLFSPNTQELGDFGWSVEVSSGLLVVSAPGENVNGIDSAGKVYVFGARTGVLLNTLSSSSPQDFGDFGISVDLANGILAVGAPFENSFLTGSVHIFDARTGSEITKIVSPSPQPGGLFGAKIDISDGRLIVGAPGEDLGRAYIFNAANGTLIMTLVSPARQEFDLGSSVAIGNQLALVGSPEQAVDGLDSSGSVYVYNVTTGALIRTIVDPNAQISGLFGSSLKMADNSVIVGAPVDNVASFTYGRVYIFNAITGSLTTTLVNPEPGVSGSVGLFGTSVDSANGRIYVGAPAQMVNGQPWAGSVYIFHEERRAYCSGEGRPYLWYAFRTLLEKSRICD